MADLYKLVVVADGSRTRVKMTPDEVAEFVTPITVDQVNTEAQRRIYDVMPQYKQANLTARAAILAAKGSENWTEDEQTEWDAGLASYEVIETLRGCSNVLNAMEPIPQDYSDDKWWS